MIKKRILLVEDEQDMMEMVRFRLEAAGFEVVPAVDGEAGLDKARKENPDLILLDLMLPKMDGYKVCGLLKNDARYSRIPIIIFTAKGQVDDIKLGQEVGANAYLTKPFDPEALLGKIRELTNE